MSSSSSRMRISTFISLLSLCVIALFSLQPNSVESIHLITQFYELPHLTRSNFTNYVDLSAYSSSSQQKTPTSSKPTRYILFYQPWQLPYIPGLFQWYYEMRHFCHLKGNQGKGTNGDFIMAVDSSNSAEIALKLGLRISEPLLWDSKTDEYYKFQQPSRINDHVRLESREKLFENVQCEEISPEKQKELDSMWRPKAGREKDILQVWRILGASAYVLTLALIVFWK